MSNLQIKGIDDQLYKELKKVAADENRSVSQQVLYLIRNHLAGRAMANRSETAAQTLLSLAGSWEDDRTADQLVADIRNDRKSSRMLVDEL